MLSFLHDHGDNPSLFLASSPPSFGVWAETGEERRGLHLHAGFHRLAFAAICEVAMPVWAVSIPHQATTFRESLKWSCDAYREVAGTDHPRGLVNIFRQQVLEAIK